MGLFRLRFTALLEGELWHVGNCVREGNHPRQVAPSFIFVAMAKRYHDTEIWAQDWWLDLPNEYKLFWQYVVDRCDHGGFFKVNVRTFNALLDLKVAPQKALEFFNAGKQRVRVVTETLWFVEDFIQFQWGTTMNMDSRVHKSIVNLLEKHNIPLTSIRGQLDLKDRAKDKVKAKEKDKDKVKSLDRNERAREVVLPWESEEFKTAWGLWVDYRKERGLRKYKAVGEQAALNRLCKLADGVEDEGIRLIELAIASNWMGFWPEKNNNGKGNNLGGRTLTREEKFALARKGVDYRTAQ